MTEQEWLASEGPAAMLDRITTWSDATPGLRSHCVRPSDRKLRLWVCACCRTNPKLPASDRSILDEIEGGRPPSAFAGRAFNQGVMWACMESAAEGANRMAVYCGTDSRPRYAALLRDIVGDPFRPVRCSITGHMLGTDTVMVRGDGTLAGCDCRWLTPDVLTLAQAAYEGNPCTVSYPHLAHDWCDGSPATSRSGTLDPARLAVLSDALEEAGCDDETLLRHLRDEEGPCPYRGALAHSLACHWCDGKTWRKMPGPHVRGCWALDLILGKE